MNLPPLNGLRAFQAAARHMSFKLAARELSVTPTAVSHQIRRLEEFLQTRLFHRDSRGLRLTDAGREYLPAVRVAFEELQRATARLVRAELAETVTISTLTYVGARSIVQRLGSFRASNPHIDVRIVTSPGPVDFASGAVDMGIRCGDGQWPGLRADRLRTQCSVPVLSPRLLAQARQPLTAADLPGLTLLHVDSEPGAWRRWLDFAGVPGADVQRGLTFDQSITAIQAAVDGLGVALGRTPFVQEQLDAGSLLAPLPLYLPDESAFYLVSPEETADRPKIRAFRDWLLAETRERES